MCEKRTRKINKGSQLVRLREARRLQRLQRLSSPTVREDSPSPPPQPVVDKHAQSRVIIEIAWKTVALMHKNRIIQQKIVALQKETSEFIAQVMKNPQYQLSTKPIHLCSPAPAPAPAQTQTQVQRNENNSSKVTPNV